LECRLYAKHNIRKDEFIGGTKDTVESLLAEAAAGGLCIVFSPLSLNKYPLSVITRKLCKYDSRGNQRNIQTIIQFTIAAVSNASNVDASGLNLKDAVAQAKDALDHIKQAPSSLEPIQGIVDASVTVLDNAKSLANIWGRLLQKVKLLTDLVDKIAEVRPRTAQIGRLGSGHSVL
jgi:hypothetical protein